MWPGKTFLRQVHDNGHQFVRYQQFTNSGFRCTSTGRLCGYTPNTSYGGQLTTPSVSPPYGSPKGEPKIKLADDTVRLLEFYHRCTGPVICSQFDQEFWSRTTLQLAQSEPCIRHAVIAIGHLTMIDTGSLKDARALMASSSKQKTLLVHYNKAIRLLVERISEPSFSPEIGLVICLLFVCIEFMRGDYDTAFSHYKSGTKRPCTNCM